MLIGYARVSTTDQETSLQLDAFGAAGVSTVYQEKASSVGARPQLQRALRVLRPGDTLVVWRIDRLARSLSDLLSILDKLALRGCSFRSLTEPIDTSSPMGVFVLQILGAVAQLERSIIRERTIAGQVAFVKRGGVFGRPKILSDDQELEALVRMREGESQSSLAREYGVSLIVMRRISAEARGKYRQGTLPVLRKYLV